MLTSDLAYYLERAAMVQYLAQQSGQMRLISDDVVKLTYDQFQCNKEVYATSHLNAFKRKYGFQ